MKRNNSCCPTGLFRKVIACLLILMTTGIFFNAQAQTPANDDCSGAIPATCGNIYSGSNEFAASDETAAGDCGTIVNSPGVWYFIDGTGDVITASLCTNTAFDSKLSVYEGSCGALVCVTGNDDFCGVQSEVEFTSTPGTTYYVLVHSFGGETGTFDLAFTCEPSSPVPANDICEDAVQVFCGEVVIGTTLGATPDGTPDCGTTNTSAGVWYSFNGTGDNITVSTCDNADFDTKISVYTDGCGFFTCVGGNDDAAGCAGNTSELSFTSSLGNQYLILVHGFSSQTGDFTLSITCTVGGDNDDCSSPLPITCGESLNGSTAGATVDAAPDCGASVTAPGVWYSFTGTGEQITLSTCNTAAYDTKISIYTDGCGLLTCVAANDDGAGCAGFTSTVSFVSIVGTEYLVLVHGFFAEEGDFTLSASCSPAIPAPPNDDCADVTATAIANGSSETFTGTTLGATQDAAEATEFGFNIVWEAFSVSGVCNNIEINYCGSVSPTFNIFARLYLGCPTGSSFLEDATGTPNDCGDGNTRYFFTNIPAGTYYIPIFADASFLNPLGDYTVTVTSEDCPPASPNDLCSDAIAIFCGDVVSGNTFGTTVDAVNSCGGTPVTAPGVWYSFTGTGDFVTVSTCGTAEYDTKLTVYTDGCGVLSCVAENDDGGGCADFTSSVGFLSVPGEEYLVLVHGFDAAAAGLFDLSVTCIEDLLPNELCSDVVPVEIASGTSATFTGTTAGSVSDPADNAEFGFKVVWHAFTVTGACNVIEVAYCGSLSPTFNIFASLYLGCPPGNTFITDDDGQPDNISCGDGNFVYTYSFAQAGTYYIPVFADEAFLDPLGDYTITVSVSDCPPVAPNDLCEDAIAIACGDVVTGSTFGTTVDNAPTCVTTNTSPGIWYSFTGTGDFVSLSTCGSATFDTKISVFTGGCTGLTCVTGNDDGAGCTGFTSTAGFASELGVEYLILVHGFLSEAGAFDLAVTCSPITVANDVCSGAIPVACGQVVSGSTIDATPDGLAACGTSITAPGVWYSYAGDGSLVTASLCNAANFDSKISVFSGSCGALTCVGGNDDGSGCALTSEFSFVAEAGTDYFILVHGFLNQSGLFDLSVSCAAPLPNDNCSSVTPVTLTNGTTVTFTGTTVGATASADETSVLTAAAVWEAVTLTGTCNNLTVDYCGTPAGVMANFFIVASDCPASTLIFGVSNNTTTCPDGNGIITFFNLPAGTYYLPVLADPAFTTLGNYTMNVVSEDCPPAPANDDCASVAPTPLTNGTPVTFTGTTVGATQNAFEAAEFGYNIVWESFTLTGGCNKDVTISYCGSFSPTFNIFASLYTDCSSGSFITDSDGQPDAVACGDGNLTYNYDNLPAGTYYIPVFADAQFLDPLGDYSVTVLSVDEIITGFTLVNSTTDQDIGPLNEGDIINLRNFPPFTIRAEACGNPASVRFDMNGAFVRNENVAPYSFTGDSPTGDYRPWAATPGAYQLEASAYTGANASGSLLGAGLVNFTVIDDDCEFLEVLITTDDFGGETSWELLDLTDNISLGSVAEGTLANNTNYRTVFCVPADHCIEFRISDAFSDGMCCAFGIGSYTLTFDGQVIATGGSFGETETVNVGTCNFDCFGTLNGAAITDINGACCQPEDLDCAGVCFGNSLGSQVLSFTLVDATTDADLGLLTDGAVIDLSITGPINVRADVCENFTTESVRFLVNGTFYVMENIPFYTIGGDNNGNYSAWNVTPGVYTIRATPYAGNNGTGGAGTYLEITITIIDGAPCGANDRRVTGFTLVSAATETDLGSLLDGAVIDLSVTGPISVRANVCTDVNVESVRFTVNGSSYRMENLPFYTIAGDNNGNYSAWNVTPGVYTIRATPYGADNGTGAVGTYAEITITIVAGSAKMGAQQQSTVEAGMFLQAYPNPFKDQLTFEFSVPADTRAQLEMFSVSGAKIATLFEGNVTGGVTQMVTFNAGELASGFYLYRMTTNDNVITDKVLLAR